MLEEDFVPEPLPRNDDDETEKYYYEDDRYFKQYSRFEIHCSMLRDVQRCSAYRRAIDQNAARHFAGKAVLDVGCGTGILSCLAARAGARVVYAIEASEMAAQAQLVAARNGYDKVIKVINKKLEDITDEIPERVDVILSEWMGCFLVFESMLESVLAARDRFLMPGGVMYPRYAAMHFAPLSYPEFWAANTGFLSDVEGIDMGVLAPSAKDQFTETAWRSMVVPPEVLIADSQLLRVIDTQTITVAELVQQQTVPFHFVVKSRQESDDLPALPVHPSVKPWRVGDPLPFHGFALWFDCIFDDRDNLSFSSSTSFSPSSSTVITSSTFEQSEPSSSSSSSSSTSPTPSPSSSSSDLTSSTLSPSSSSTAALESSQTPVVLSTRPGIRTHWEQDVCMFPDFPLTQIGDSIKGILQMQRNHHWKRHYDIEFSFRVNTIEIYKYITI